MIRHGKDSGETQLTRPSRWPALFVALIAFAAIASASAQTASPETKPSVMLEAVSGSQPLQNGIQIQAGAAQLRITALRDDIIRVRIAPGTNLPEDASWAVLAASRTSSVNVQPTQDASSVGFRTASLNVSVERNPLRLVVRDLTGNIISADALGRPTAFSKGGLTVY